ncbi:MAG: COX15/CtaA family protein [Proteobacteria bacterium]|nr:COX15/CtaA family protein [Pseudomonadota bacterium]
MKTHRILLQRRSLFHRFLYLNIIYTLAVIIWGALVRATGSGAGCGAHWPLCHNQVVILDASMATWIEWIHRAMSGLLLITIALAVVFSYSLYGKGHKVRRISWVVLVCVFIEAAIGAALVLLKLVGQDQSPLRAYVMGGHLINTFFLLASQYLHYRISITSFLQERSIVIRRWFSKMWFVCTSLLLLTAAIGAMVALGDTLFTQTAHHSQHFLIRLRIYHPGLAVIAILVVSYYVYHNQSLYSSNAKLVRSGHTLLFLAFIQIAVGGLNWLMHVPITTQLLHLLFACLFWLQHIAFGVDVFEANQLPYTSTDTKTDTKNIPP